MVINRAIGGELYQEEPLAAVSKDAKVDRSHPQRGPGLASHGTVGASPGCTTYAPKMFQEIAQQAAKADAQTSTATSTARGPRAVPLASRPWLKDINLLSEQGPPPEEESLLYLVLNFPSMPMTLTLPRHCSRLGR